MMVVDCCTNICGIMCEIQGGTIPLLLSAGAFLLSTNQGRSHGMTQGARPPIKICLALLRTNNEW